MILAALKDYHDRLAENGDMTPSGWDRKAIDYIVVIDRDGNPVNLECTQEKQDKKMVAKSFLVPSPVKRSSGIKSNLLWDNIDYALGISNSGKPDRTPDCHKAFIDRVDELDLPENEGINALKKFLAVQDKEQLLREKFGTQCDEASASSLSEQEEAEAEKKPDSKYDEMLKNCQNLTFRLQGCSVPIFSDKEVMACVNRMAGEQTDSGGLRRCLVTGKKTTIARLHPPIKGVRGAQSTGANIVSYNAPSFCSYGMDQGNNAPIGEDTAEAYTKAVNILLGKGTGRSFLVADATTVVWSEKACAFEEEIVSIFSEPPKDNPDKNIEAVRALFKAPLAGAAVIEDASNHFYVLGLSPNASRISIRFWITGTVASMSERIRQHFKDIEIVHGSMAPDYLSIFRLLTATAMLGKADNIPPNLGGDTMRAILEGLPYPATLLQSAVIRNRAEQNVTYPRAALIKGCLNRLNSNERKMTVEIDKENTNVGYRLGRLFATLEKIQSDAHPGLNATIRDRFYGAASSTPRTVFGNLMRLKNHHLGKLGDGSRIFYERVIAEILESMDDFPAHLNIANQGRFAIGYYHQMQSFYTKRAGKEQAETAAAPESNDLF